ncbi:hypothetical protein Plhal304r1_c014g0051401 [Plasmopara halstedii]
MSTEQSATDNIALHHIFFRNRQSHRTFDFLFDEVTHKRFHEIPSFIFVMATKCFETLNRRSVSRLQRPTAALPSTIIVR